MGPIESSLRASLLEARGRLDVGKKDVLPPAIPASDNRVMGLEEEIIHLKRKIMILTAQLKMVRSSSRKDAGRPAVEYIIDMVCENEGVAKIDIVSKRRPTKWMLPRQMCYYLAATRTIASTTLIGAIFNKADHTAVLHGRDKIAALRLTDRELDKKLSEYESALDRLSPASVEIL